MSYEKIVDPGLTKEQYDLHIKEWGGYNQPPPGFTEITAEEFAQSGFFIWCLSNVEFRQIDPNQIPSASLLNPIKHFLSVKMFYMNHGDHYAISNDYWDKKIRYFKFAKCFHDWNEISAEEAKKPAFSCYHYCKCTKCGAEWEYDSSG